MQTSSARGRSPNLPALDLSGDPVRLQNGLATLVLTIAELLREVLERQALRRVEHGSLTKEEVERLGIAFMTIDSKLAEMSRAFGVKHSELRNNLASLLRVAADGYRSTDLVEVIDRLLEKGVVAAGQVRVAVADVDLVGLDLLAILHPIYREGDRPARRH